MKFTILTLCLLFLGLTTFCQDWVSVGADTDDNKWYVKSTYVKKDLYSGGGIKIWTKQESKQMTITTKSGETVKLTNAKELQLIVVNCKERKMKLVSSTVYNSQGKMVSNLTLQDYEQDWIDVVPDSMGEAMLDKTCELFN
jgi:hypothetical protein